MRLITDTLPDQTKAYGAVAMFAPLGLYLKNVQFNHIRDGYKEPCFMVVAVGLSSSGKSDINRIRDFIHEATILMRTGAKRHLLKNTIHAHPTLSEIILQ